MQLLSGQAMGLGTDSRLKHACFQHVFDSFVTLLKRQPIGWPKSFVSFVGLARTVYIQCIYGIFGRGIIKYTVNIYGSGQLKDV